MKELPFFTPLNYITMVLLQNVGIDASMKELHVCFMALETGQLQKIKGTRTFANSPKGFTALLSWATKKARQTTVRFTMEATGVYYESLAYFLHQRDCYVSVVLPNQSKAFIESLNLKSKTDKLEAKALAQMGVERQLPQWEPVSEQMYQIKRHCRERVMLLEEKTMIANRLHAEQHCAQPNKMVIKRTKQRLKLLEKQVAQVEHELRQLVAQDQQLAERITNIEAIKGLSFITVVTVVAETNGFALFDNRGQLTSFAGYDVVERQSGSSVKGRTRISKKGNRYIRRALHLPSLSVIRYNDTFRHLYERVYERTKIKMKGIVAVQRKLLILIYTLFKKNQAYDPEFMQHSNQQNSRQDTVPAYPG